MAIHIKEMTSEVAVFEGELPLSEKQTEALVLKIMQRLAENEKTAGQAREATTFRRGATPRLEVEG